MLAPLYNLGSVQELVGRLTVLPLPLVGACASPVRAIWTTGDPLPNPLLNRVTGLPSV